MGAKKWRRSVTSLHRSYARWNSKETGSLSRAETLVPKAMLQIESKVKEKARLWKSTMQDLLGDLAILGSEREGKVREEKVRSWSRDSTGVRTHEMQNKGDCE